MARKMNNKTLLIILAALIGLFAAVRVFRTMRINSNMGRGLIETIDTARVTSVELFPSSEKGSKIVFTKDNSTWKVEKNKLKTDAEENAVRALLSEISNLKIDQLIARGKSKWKESAVDDSSGSGIKIYEGSKLLLEMIVGKFNYHPSRNQYQQYGGGGVSGNTCVRVAGNEDVYAVPGFLGYAVNQPFNNWRNQSFIKADKANVTKISFKYPADSSYVIEKKDTVWFMGTKALPKKHVEDFLDKIAWKSNAAFADDYIPSGNTQYQMVIEGTNMTSVVVSAFVKTPGAFVLNSSINPKNYFNSDRAGLDDIFPKKELFLTEMKKK